MCWRGAVTGWREMVGAIKTVIAGYDPQTITLQSSVFASLKTGGR